MASGRAQARAHADDTLRPSVLLSRLIDLLGAPLLRPLVPDAGLQVEVRGVFIHDPNDQLSVAPGDLVLGVGVESEGVAGLLTKIGEQEGAGLVVKCTCADEARQAVADTGTAVLTLTRDASWAHLTELVRSVVSVAPGHAGSTGTHAEDLFSLANAIATILDCPVTIEDRSSTVLAFSDRQDEADQGRIQTILGRQVPEQYLSLLTEHGAFRQLVSRHEPILIPPLFAGMTPRTAMAVRAGDELLGSIWAASHRPLTDEQLARLVDAAGIVALHLLRMRAGADVGRGLQAELVATVLEGGSRAAAAASRLGIGSGPLRVVAAQPSSTTDRAGREGELARLADALTVHFSVLHAHAATALVGGVVYTLLPETHDRDDAGAAAVELGRTFLARSGGRTDVVIAVGGRATALHRLPRAREEADRTLRVLHTQSTEQSRRVARMADVHLDSLLLRVADVLSEDEEGAIEPIRALLEHDDKHNTGLVETLRGFLESSGDVGAVAVDQHVHPNTIRYRLRRILDLSGLDLDDPDVRLAAILALRLHRARADQG